MNAVRRTRILIVDDHPIVRKGLAQLLNQERDFLVCGEALDHTGALAAIVEHAPDFVIADLSLKNSDGLALVKDIHARWPQLPVLVLSMYDENVYAERVLRAGARGYVMKQEALEKVLDAVRRILSGEPYVSENVQQHLVRSVSQTGALDAGARLARLSDRELEVFQLVGEGLNPREIGLRLHLSPKTIETHCARIREKLDLKDSTELLRCATLWLAGGSASW
jgi:DNA-binding NarL/FixJ family response regulator